MARASSSSSQSSSQAQPLQATSPLGDLNVSTPVGETMAMPGSTEMGVNAPSTVSTSTQITRPEMGTVIPHSPMVFLRLPAFQVLMLLQIGLDLMNEILLTQQIGTVFNPLIRETSRSYQALTTQMGRITDFFAPRQLVYQPVTHIQNQQPLQLVETMVQRQQHVPQPQPVEPVIQGQPEVILVDRNDNADEVFRNVQQQNIEVHNNIANLVENIMAQNGLNIGMHRPNFVSWFYRIGVSVPSKANFNVLLGREWIHGVGAVPSTVHQRIAIWKDDGLVENVEADQSYFLAEVNTITKKNFDKQLAHITPVMSPGPKCMISDDEMYSMKLQPEAGFVWEREFREHDYVMVNQKEISSENEDMLRTRASAYKKVDDSLTPGFPKYAM
ncbi:hypothetical protein MTR_1g052435 [Medicago truncatula]|uniref:Uncharacterized protein n=1 Tax=Medicago truncatula TaxID=3880 RepID=A0A072VJF6_MEDTR|nr:hypothetical protein MTR_1g052435 [Medicago truncatula]